MRITHFHIQRDKIENRFVSRIIKYRHLSCVNYFRPQTLHNRHKIYYSISWRWKWLYQVSQDCCLAKCIMSFFLTCDKCKKRNINNVPWYGVFSLYWENDFVKSSKTYSCTIFRLKWNLVTTTIEYRRRRVIYHFFSWLYLFNISYLLTLFYYTYSQQTNISYYTIWVILLYSPYI
jgi:hypothetical protein